MKVIITFVCYFITTNLYSAVDYKDALSLNGNIKNGEKIYQMCGSCHGKDGSGKKNGSFPVIASQYKSVIIKQLQDIKNKKRHNPTMYPFSDIKTMGGLQGVADVATYIQNLPKITNNGIGGGKNLTRGKKLYNNNCAFCHGVYGNGNSNKVYPKISNQHYEYLLRQLKWMKKGYRKNSNPAMLVIIKNMSDEDFQDLADYISRLR
jgi:cytochrome c553